MSDRQLFRLPAGGRIARDRPLSFTFDGRTYQGYAGDSLAAALLANGVRLVARSFKYHRPRGVLSAGVEEPNALVHLRDGARREPNTRATQVELYDGLTATSQNRWPSLGFDVSAINGLFSPIFVAGFYYKTFMGPTRGAWMVYERFIRKAAGLGEAAREADPDRYEKRHAHCDVLVVGGGPAGLAAALAAARSGARVMLVEQEPAFGGALLGERAEIDGTPALDWVAACQAELAERPEVTLLARTTAFGYYDHNTLGLVERVADHHPAPAAHQPRQRLWTLRAGQVVLATGALERPLVFADNDRPGVMLASAVRHYVNRYAVLAGRRALVFATHDEAYRTAFDLADAGAVVAGVVDPRPAPGRGLAEALAARGIEHLPGHAVQRALGAKQVAAAEVVRLAAGGRPSGHARRLDCDLVCVSGGWNPSIHLSSQTGAKPAYDTRLATFLPGPPRQAERSAGAAAGRLTLADCLAEGLRAGAEAAAAAGFGDGTSPPAPAASEEPEARPEPLWDLPGGRGKRFLDLQNDVTAKDVALAAREGYRSVEHLKRYTTLGMATDQGKTSNLLALAQLAAHTGEPIPQVGTTTFRPPYTPVALGALAGRHVRGHYQPVRRTPLHDWHARHGAVFVEAGLWLRPRYYPRDGEGLFEAQNREARHVREKVGLVDVSTLGKIDVQGPDAAEFLNRVYVNGWKTLAVGKARYGLMLREDGMVFDDGTTSRLGERRYLMTTTTANAARVLSHLEFHLQAVWPELKVHVSSLTDQWAAMALAGPRARRVLAAALDDLDVSDAALPFMGVAEGRIAGLPVRVFRISFSGELAYEVNTPSDHAEAVWEALLAAGREQEIIPYGTEAMAVLRIEKGHVAGPELNGQTTPHDLGLGRMVSTKKPFIGSALLKRPALTDPERPRLVGLVPVDGETKITAGAQLVEDPAPPPPVKMLGHVTSVTWSENLGRPIALALLAGGEARAGQRLVAADPLRGRNVPVEVVPHIFIDPEGERLHA